MNVMGTNISCGIGQLTDVGSKPSVRELRRSIQDAESSGYGILLASLADYQGTLPVRTLKKCGFRQIGRWKTNVNSGNKIALFQKRLRPKQDR